MIVMIVHKTYSISILICSTYDANLFEMFTAELKIKPRKSIYELKIEERTREKSQTAKKPEFPHFLLFLEGGGNVSFLIR